MIFLRPTRYIEEEDAPLPVTDTTPGSGMCRITPLTLACSALTPGQLRAGRDKAIGTNCLENITLSTRIACTTAGRTSDVAPALPLAHPRRPTRCCRSSTGG